MPITKIIEGVVKLGVGAGQAISGAIKRKKADAMLPSGPTAEESALAERTERQLRQAEVNAPESELNAAQRTQQMMTSAMVKQGATPAMIANTASYMQPLQQDIAMRSMEKASGLLSALTQQKGKFGDIKRDVQMLRSARKSAQAEKNIKGGTQNMMGVVGGGGGLMKAVGGLFKGKGGKV